MRLCGFAVVRRSVRAARAQMCGWLCECRAVVCRKNVHASIYSAKNKKKKIQASKTGPPCISFICAFYMICDIYTDKISLRRVDFTVATR